MATAGKISHLLDSISNSNDLTPVLESLNTLLSVTNPHELSQISPNVSFDVVFNCLSSANEYVAFLLSDYAKFKYELSTLNQ